VNFLENREVWIVVNVKQQSFDNFFLFFVIIYGTNCFADLFGNDLRIHHFLKLYYAIRILISSNEKSHNDIEKARMILESFVTDSISVYSRIFIV